MNKTLLEGVIEALEKGAPVRLNADDFSAFLRASTEGNPHVSPAILENISQGLTKDDIPTFQRAIQAIQEEELGWLGFKIVFDEQAAVSNTDNEVTKKYGDQGSADGKNLVFFCNDEKEVIASRAYSPRDFFQMKDVTRGPSMHNDQFEGLTWVSEPLFQPVKVWLLGASDAAVEVAQLAAHVGFEVEVIDYDEAYVSESRFPVAQRTVLSGFDALSTVQASPKDYVCVLTRGHMFDPEACVWAIQNKVHYVGMMGCAGKNSTVHDLCIKAGLTEGQWDSIKRPIGLNFGAKTPAELAIAIVAELVDVRYKQRYSKGVQEKHDMSLGRN